MLGRVVDGEAVPEFIGHFCAIKIDQRLEAVAVRLSIIKWIVSALGYF